MVGGVAGEEVGHAGLDAEAGERVLADLLELGAEGVLAVAELDAALVHRVGRVRLGERHRRVEVVRPGLERRLEQRRVEVRRAEVADDVDAVLLGERGDGVGVSGVDLLRNEARVVQLGAEVVCPRRVVVGHDHLLEPRAIGVAALGDGGDRLAYAAGADDECLHQCAPPGP